MTAKGRNYIFWLTAFLLLLAVVPVQGAEPGSSQQKPLRGAHANLACADCHTSDSQGKQVADCSVCHIDQQGVLHGPMAHRRSEQAFTASAFDRYDPRFFEKNCSSCHVTSCGDCHSGGGHATARPGREDCHRCHRGYFVGADYWGLAPREDSQRYQRGIDIDGEKYLKMRPDVHAEAGLDCGDCHSMASLAAGSPGKGCRDCHQPDLRIIEHRIAAHQESLECYACHASWGAQEYGSFFLRVADNPVGDIFQVRREPGSEYLRSAYLKRQDAPPLAWNAAGRVSPVRPQFIAYYSDLRVGGKVENALAAAQWKAYVPHTIRRGTVTCDGCHDDPRRFLLEAADRRIYLPDKDGMTLPSFWDSNGQTLSNGRFFTPGEFARLSGRSPEYIRNYVEKWKNLVKHVDGSSAP